MPKRRAPDRTGGVANSGTINTNGGHVVGGNLSINSAEAVVEAFEARGLLQIAETAGLQRRVVVMLAQRLKPAERLDFEQAITELERAVEIALDVIERGERGSNEDAFVNAVLAEVAAKIHDNDLDGGAKALADALAAIDRRETAQRETAQRERIIDALQERTRERVPLDWAMTQNNLGTALQTLGQRESGTARLEQAVNAYHDALLEWTRERVPLQWATTQNNLGIALRTLGERESGTARLEQAVNAYRDALEEWTQEHAPHYCSLAQRNLKSAIEALRNRQVPS